MPELLRADGITAGYGDSIILEDIALNLAAGESLALLGRNGVGKTTLLLTLMGLARLRQGRIVFNGEEITQLPTHRRAHAGLGWVPQERFMFPSLTVEEHLSVVARPGGPWNLERIYKMFPRLEERRRYDDAEKYLRKALALWPQLPDAQTSLGMIALRLGREDDAIIERVVRVRSGEDDAGPGHAALRPRDRELRVVGQSKPYRGFPRHHGGRVRRISGDHRARGHAAESHQPKGRTNSPHRGPSRSNRVGADPALFA